MSGLGSIIISAIVPKYGRDGGVRNLSLRSAAAAKDTADLIEGTVKKVHTGSELVNKTNNAFRKVGGIAAIAA